MPTPDLTPFQIGLIQLSIIAYRLSWANFLVEKTIQSIPKFEIKNIEKTPERKKNDALLTILFEYIVLNLDQLIEAHPIIAKNLHDEGFIELEKALNKLWKPIQDKDEKIRHWRDKYVAHSQKRTIEYISSTDIDTDYFETQKEIFRLSRLGTFYISGVFENFEHDYKEAMRIHKEIVSKLKPAQMHEQWEEMKKYTNEILLETTTDLKKAGYIPAYPIDFGNILDEDKELEEIIKKIFSN